MILHSVKPSISIFQNSVGEKSRDKPVAPDPAICVHDPGAKHVFQVFDR